MQIFDAIIFFKLSAIQQKTVKPTYPCLLGARKLAEGKGHETASKSSVDKDGTLEMQSSVKKLIF